MKKLKQILLLMSCLFCLCACGDKSADTKAEAPTPTQFDPNQKIYAIIEVQDYGTIKAQLRPDCAPITVDNFVKLAESGFYDGLTFHRIMSGFMIQGGDPEGTGKGGSGNPITGEFAANGISNPLSHMRGTLSMGRRAYDYNSASSQFFIVHADHSDLDGNYASFGTVIEGIEVVDAICEKVIPIDDNGTVLAEDQPVITKITIERE